MELDLIPYSLGSVCEYKNSNNSSNSSTLNSTNLSSSKSNLYGSSISNSSSNSNSEKYSISTPSTPMSHSYNITFNITPPNQSLITSSPIINSQSGNLLNTSTNSTNSTNSANNNNNNINNNSNNNNNSSYLTVSSYDLPETLKLNKCYQYCNTNFNNGKPDNYNPLKHLYEPPSPVQPAQLSLSQSSQPLPQQPPPPQILINNSDTTVTTPTPIIIAAEEQQPNNGVVVAVEQSSNSTNFDLDNPTQRKRSTSFSMKNLNILSHQVAGQAPLLKLPNGKILKPMVPQEYHFYESIQYHNEFVGFTPKFYGVLDLKNYDFRYLEETFKSQHNSHSIDYNHWRNKTINLPKDWQNLYIKIEDLTYLCKYPCILDLKMGTRQHGVDAPIDKVNKMQQKCKLTTSSSLGFRVCGLKVYDQKQGTYGTYDKFYGRNLKDTDIPAVICKFVDNGLRHRTEILSGIAKRLYQLISLFETQTCFKFYGGSLLLIYDQSTSLQDAKINIKMVDFAHASPNHTHHPTNNNSNNNGNGNGLDEGYLFGLKNLLKIINNLVQISNVNIGETCYF